jgi:hypothetical protein
VLSEAAVYLPPLQSLARFCHLVSVTLSNEIIDNYVHIINNGLSCRTVTTLPNSRLLLALFLVVCVLTFLNNYIEHFNYIILKEFLLENTPFNAVVGNPDHRVVPCQRERAPFESRGNLTGIRLQE